MNSVLPETTILQTLSLLRSMIEGGEQFTPTSLDAYREALVAIEKFPRWVSVKEGQPEEGEYFVLYNIKDGGGEGYMGTGEYDKETWFAADSYQVITHWLKGVPELPTSEQTKETT